MKLVNLTPHDVNIYTDNGVISYPSEGLARISVNRSTSEIIENIPFINATYGKINGLPEPTEGVIYIISFPTYLSIKTSGEQRNDIVYPFDEVRNDRGQIIGCRALARC